MGITTKPARYRLDTRSGSVAIPCFAFAAYRDFVSSCPKADKLLRRRECPLSATIGQRTAANLRHINRVDVPVEEPSKKSIMGTNFGACVPDKRHKLNYDASLH